MRKKTMIFAVLTALLLSASACGAGEAGRSSGEISSAVPGELTSAEALKLLSEKLPLPDTADDGTLTEYLKLYEALDEEGRKSVSLFDYTKLTEAGYRTANAEKLAAAEQDPILALTAVAKAFYDQSADSHAAEPQKPQTQYDMNNYRRNYNAAPEDAAAQKTLFVDCSSFVNSVYYYTFGANLLSNGKSVTTSNVNKDLAPRRISPDMEVMFYITGRKLESCKKDKAEAAAVLEEIKAALQPGDVINYYRASSGHMVMYLGDGKIIHSIGSANVKTTGGDTDPKTSVENFTADEAAFGSVTIDDWDLFFTEEVTPASQKDGRTGTGNRYLFADNVKSVGVFRPTNPENGRMKGLKASEQAVDHYLYAGLDIEKTAEVRHDDQTRPLYYGSSIPVGAEVTFTVTIRNLSDTVMQQLNFSEVLPEALEYVSSPEDMVLYPAERTLVQHVKELAAGETLRFSYTVKAAAAAGTLAEDTGTYINHIRTNPMLSQLKMDQDTAKLEAAVAGTLGKAFDSGFAAVQAVYAAQEGVNAAPFTDAASEEALFAEILPDNLPDFGAAGGMMVRTLYGGWKVGSAEISAALKDGQYDDYNLRVHRVTEQDLEDGDIILSYTGFGGGAYRTLLYFEGEVYGLNAVGCFGKLPASGLSSGRDLQSFLDTLTAYNLFMVLRPALLPDPGTDIDAYLCSCAV